MLPYICFPHTPHARPPYQGWQCAVVRVVPPGPRPAPQLFSCLGVCVGLVPWSWGMGICCCTAAQAPPLQWGQRGARSGHCSCAAPKGADPSVWPPTCGEGAVERPEPGVALQVVVLEEDSPEVTDSGSIAAQQPGEQCVERAVGALSLCLAQRLLPMTPTAIDAHVSATSRPRSSQCGRDPPHGLTLKMCSGTMSWSARPCSSGKTSSTAMAISVRCSFSRCRRSLSSPSPAMLLQLCSQP